MKKLISLTLSILLVLGLVACGPKEDSTPEQSENITIKVAGLKGPTSIGMIQMIDSMPNLNENVQVDYEILATPDALVGKLLNSEFDFATVPTNLAATIYNKKNNYQIAGVSIWGVLYVVSNGIDINDWSDFKGQTIFPFMQGSTPDVLFKYLLEKAGIDPNTEVQLDYSIPQAELAQALAADRVNLAILPEPFVTVALMKNPKLSVVMDLQAEWKKLNASDDDTNSDYAYPQTSVIVNSEFAAQHPDLTAEFLKAYEGSIIWVNENVADAALLVEKHEIGLNAKAAEQAIPRCNLNFVSASDAIDTTKSYLNILYDFSPKYVGGQLPDENLFYIQD